MLLSFKRYLIFRVWKSFTISEKWEIIFLVLFFFLLTLRLPMNYLAVIWKFWIVNKSRGKKATKVGRNKSAVILQWLWCIFMPGWLVTYSKSNAERKCICNYVSSLTLSWECLLAFWLPCFRKTTTFTPPNPTIALKTNQQSKLETEGRKLG